jgi:hypothetical protein
MLTDTHQTPQQTDGRIDNPFLLDPALLPSFHVFIRLPPSIIPTSTATASRTASGSLLPSAGASISSFNLSLDRMAVKFGDTGYAAFGDWAVRSDRGGVSVGYVRADNANVGVGTGGIRGTWEVAQSLTLNITE